ncbi:MAG: cation:proton antiporter [Gammaproteobacteria bacterium]|nr:cation:proton antiporter [Gammaproteobacteria bacterium]
MTEQGLHGDPIAPVILGVTGILFFAVIGRFLARRFGQPTVLGELFMGILLGNAAWYLEVDLITVLREGPRVFELVSASLSGISVHEVATAIFGADKGNEIVRIISGPHGGEVMQVAQTVDVFSRYGVIFLLFVVGLETEISEMRRVGADSIRVAVLGVIVPFAFGFAAAGLLMPELSLNSMLFVAATLGATSVGITANVLVELGRNRSVEGHIILGAAICDDVLGLIILAVVSGIIVSGSVDLLHIGLVVFMSALFVSGAAVFGPKIVQFSAAIMGRLDIVEAKMFTSYLFVMVLAWIANLAGLATIVGAFAAGVVLSDSYFKEYEKSRKNFVSIRELIMPLEVVLVPIFFILMGIQVKLESFLSVPVLFVAGGLLIAAILGKLASGLGARRQVDRLVIGIGMIPRGEVGLVFAAIGRALDVIDDALFSAIVLMVMVTTLISPPLLKAAINRRGSRMAPD